MEQGRTEHLSQPHLESQQLPNASISLLQLRQNLLRTYSVPGTTLEMNKTQALILEDLNLVEATDALKISAR